MQSLNRENQVIIKGQGLTDSEKYLSELCSKTFLSLWSYPNVHHKSGKELCDLLVVFGNHILIFSDKNCQYGADQDQYLNWSRWFDRAITKSAKQLWGAERKIKENPESVFLDSKCSQPFPFEIDISKVKVHLILVARGVSEACQKSMGGDGSLTIANEVKGIDAHIEPFIVGDIDPEKTFIHILDDNILDIIMGALDTIPDFVSYISRKEILFRSDKKIYILGEENLLPSYLGQMKDKQHDFNFPDNKDLIFITDGVWKNFCGNPQRQAQLEANIVSYMWDNIIEKFNKHVLDNSLYTAPDGGIKSSEKSIRCFASESRFRRRILADYLANFLKRTSGLNSSHVAVKIEDGCPSYIYIFVALSRNLTDSEEEYRANRRAYLETCCRIYKSMNLTTECVIGFATETIDPTNLSAERSEDFMFIDGKDWNEIDQKEAKQLQQETGIFEAIKLQYTHHEEFPKVGII